MNKLLRLSGLLLLCGTIGAGSGCSTFRSWFSRKPETRTPRQKLAEKAEQGRGPKNRSVTRQEATWMDDLIRTKRYDDTPYLSGSDLNDRERKNLEAVMSGDNVGQSEIDRIHRKNENMAQENHEKIWGKTISNMGKSKKNSAKETDTAEK